MLFNLKWVTCWLVVTPVFLAQSMTASAIELTPFATRNQNPLVQIYGLPPAEPATLLDSGQAAARLTLDLANSYTRSGSSSESLLLDGETYRSNLALRYGVTERLQVGIDLPHISHSRGFFDGFIENWHNSFNLPDGERNQAPRDRLTYSYQRNSQPLLDLTDSSAGLGDLLLSGAWQLVRETGGRPGAASLVISLKLPTGDSDKLLGSGSTDLALTLNGQREAPVEMGRVAAFASLGALLMTDGKVLENQRRNLAGFGSLGFGWAPYDWLALKLQLDGHSSFYKNSDLNEIDTNSVQLVLGGALQLTESATLDLAVAEDIMVHTAPDVVFHLALRNTF